MNIEQASQMDEAILEEVMNKEKYEPLRSYEINVALYIKHGKYDKDGNLKSTALAKNGIPIPAQIKLVSSFNRITDSVDAKIVLNKELWDEYSKEEKKSVIDNCLNYIEVKTDKVGEPVMIAEDSDKVSLKLRKPDFCVEGFLDMLNEYKSDYIPWQDAHGIAQKVSNPND